MLSERHIELLEARGFDAEVVVRHGVEGCPEFGSAWIAIPYLENGVQVGRKLRTLGGDKKFAQDKGSKQIFWNVDCLLDPSLDGSPLIITEGEFDALSALQAGYARTVSVPGGAPDSAIEARKKYDFLDTAPRLAEVREIILATDDDGPGSILLNDLAERLGRARCKWVRYPKGCKDLNDALRLYGTKGVVATIAKAAWVRVAGVARMSELPPLKEQPVHDVGISGLFPHFRLRRGDLSVVLGVPGSGKTAWVNAVSGHMAMQYDWTVAAASFEQRAQIDFRRNLRTFHAGRKVVDMGPEQLRAADEWIDARYALIVPDVEDEVTLEWMLERAQVAIVQYGASLITIDPVNEMDHLRPEGMTETDYTGLMLKAFKRLAFRFQVHVMLAVHPAKMQRNKDGAYPVPSLYDAAGSAHWYNKPDQGVIIHRGGEETLIRVAKSKYHDVLGHPGDLKVQFNIATGRYAPVPGRSGGGVALPYPPDD